MINHVIPMLAPVDQAAVAKESDIVKLTYAKKVRFIVQFGVITGDAVVLTIVPCDDTTPSNTTTAITFAYRKSSAVGTDNMGAVATSAALSVSAGDDGKTVVIEVEGQDLPAGYPCCKCVATPGGSMSVCLVAMVAEVETMYPGDTQPSHV